MSRGGSRSVGFTVRARRTESSSRSMVQRATLPSLSILLRRPAGEMEEAGIHPPVRPGGIFVPLQAGGAVSVHFVSSFSVAAGSCTEYELDNHILLPLVLSQSMGHN